MLFTKKRSGSIKERGCDDFRKQHDYTKKEETYAPTVSTEALMISCLMDTKEGRYVVTIGIPRAFMHDYIKMRLI